MNEHNFQWTDELAKEYGSFYKTFWGIGNPIVCFKELIRKKQALFSTHDESKRPPLGIEPQYIWKQKRLDELNSAINRYTTANKPVSSSWVAEIQELTEWLNNREEEKLFDAGNINAEDAFSYFKKFIHPHEKKQIMQDFLNYVKKIN